MAFNLALMEEVIDSLFPRHDLEFLYRIAEEEAVYIITNFLIGRKVIWCYHRREMPSIEYVKRVSLEDGRYRISTNMDVGQWVNPESTWLICNKSAGVNYYYFVGANFLILADPSDLISDKNDIDAHLKEAIHGKT